jgi:hypothetical protein
MVRVQALDPRNPTLGPGAVRVAGAQILEADGSAAGTYRAAIKIPAYALLKDVVIHNEAVWDAGTDADMVVGLYGDSDGAVGTVIDADEIFTSTSLKATDLTAGQSISFLRPGGVSGGFLSEGTNTHFLDAMDVVDRWVVVDVTTTGTVGSAGKTYVFVEYAVPEMDVATFTAT